MNYRWDGSNFRPVSGMHAQQDIKLCTIGNEYLVPLVDAQQMNPGIAKNIFISLIIFGSFTLCAQVPFHKGVNLTNWFQAASPRQIQFRKFTKQDFQNIKSLGCDVIRLPINLHAMTSGAPDYTLDPLFLNFLDQAVDWSEELNIYLILDNHSFDPAVSTSPDIENILIKVWPQLANSLQKPIGFSFI